MTVRGQQCLESADVVLYDHLVPPRLLRSARPEAEKIDVGVAAPQPHEQEAICYLLAEKAREGKVVARLKWGDPFVFDSGGAEALFLHEQGVRFEVVPGIPAGIAVPSYAGIPITYPGGGDTLAFVRGHEDDGKAQRVGRLGRPRPPRRHDRLLRRAAAAAARFSRRSSRTAGPAEDSAAVIYDGTLPTQETVVGTLDEMARNAGRSTDRRAAILVVGRVVALARAPALVRRPAAVRQAHPGDAAKAAGVGARRPARGCWAPRRSRRR